MNESIAIVVTYNRKELLQKNIRALLGQSRADFDILVIDNASTDGTQELVGRMAEESSRIAYINTGSNLGGAGGFSYGMQIACEKDYKYCWLMDDDTIPGETAYEHLVDKLDFLQGDFSFICSYVKWIDGTICAMNIPGVKRSLITRLDLLDHNMLWVKTCSFVSVLINLEVAREVGLPIKEFFIYGDDAEYTLRLSGKRKGYWALDSIVEHRMGRNAGVDIVTEGEDRLDRHFYNVRNLTYIAKKYGINGIPMCLLHTFGDTYRVLRYASDKKRHRIALIWKGFWAGLWFHPAIIYVNKQAGESGK